MKQGLLKGLLIAFIAVIIGIFYSYDLGHYLTLEALQANREFIVAYYLDHQLLVLSAYVLTYFTVTAASLPGALILTLLGGAIFGPFLGTFVILSSATSGAAIAFLSGRYIFRDVIEEKYTSFFDKINDGIDKDGIYYLLFLRLVPFPFFVVNIVLGLTRVSLVMFYITTFFGMAPGTFVFANAASQLSQIDSLSGLVSGKMLLSFALLGVLALSPIIKNRFTLK